MVSLQLHRGELVKVSFWVALPEDSLPPLVEAVNRSLPCDLGIDLGWIVRGTLALREYFFELPMRLVQVNFVPVANRFVLLYQLFLCFGLH